MYTLPRTTPPPQLAAAAEVDGGEEVVPIDQALLACTAVAIAPLIEGMSWVVPRARSSEPSRVPATGNALARSVQQGMAARDIEARSPTPAQARRNAARVTRAMAESRRGESSILLETEQDALLEEYAALWSLALTTPDSAAEAKPRIAEIDEIDPGVMEAYVSAVLYAAREWDLGCGTPGS